MRDPGALACSLVPPLPVPAPASCLRRSVLAWQPLEMELPLSSPARSRVWYTYLLSLNALMCIKLIIFLGIH
jgi:hypothetical protein